MTGTDRTARRFPILFTGASHGMRVLGLAPGSCWVELGGESMVVRMGWAFRMRAPLDSIRAAMPDTGRVLGWGVHGWRGQWLVNGSSDGLVRVEIEPACRALMSGLPVQVRVLRVSLVDPDGFIDEVRARMVRPGPDGT